MNKIKLDAIDSTNAYIRRKLEAGTLPDFTVVSTEHQTRGTGQPGAIWNSEAGKNLTFSVLKYFEALAAAEHFKLNMAVSLAVAAALEAAGIPEISVKWPNDMLSGGMKIGGILIENTLRGAAIARSVVGIGLNVNQTEFPGLPRASSLAAIGGKAYDREGLLERLLEGLTLRLTHVETDRFADLREAYQARMFARGEVREFRDANRSPFRARILGVDGEGRLELESASGGISRHGFRSLQLVY